MQFAGTRSFVVNLPTRLSEDGAEEGPAETKRDFEGFGVSTTLRRRAFARDMV